MKFILLSVFVFIAFAIYAQDDFKPLKCKGPIPESILEQAKDAFARDQGRISGDESVNKDKRDAFYAQVNYKTSSVLKNGKVLFGDEVSIYINDLAAKIFEIIPHMKDRVEFYVVKDSEVSAVSSSNGTIFINIGLIAQVENEAQLAFLMINELIHYMDEHGLQSYMKIDALNTKKEEIDLHLEAFMKLFSEYSEGLYIETDSICLNDFYLKMGYDIDEALKVFDVLMYSYLPFDEKEFDLSHFDDENFKIPSKYHKKEPNSITSVEEFDDSYSVHPKIAKRRANIYKVAADLAVENGKKKFLLDASRFVKIQKMARYELCRIYNNELDYGRALYSCYLLMKNDSTSNYLNQMYTYALYALTKYTNDIFEIENGSTSSVYHKTTRKVSVFAEGYTKSEMLLLDVENCEGESSMLYHLISEIPAKDLNIVVLRELCKAMIQFPDDKFLRRIAIDVFMDLKQVHGMELDDFETERFVDTANFVELTTEEYEKLGKYDKIRYDKKLKALEDKGGGSYHGNALLAFINDEHIQMFFEEAKERSDSFVSKKESLEYIRKSIFPRAIRRYKPDPSLPIKKIVAVNPLFELIRFENFKYLESEENELVMLDMIEETSEKAGVDVDLLDAYRFKSTDVDRYNDLSVFKNYYSEYFVNDYLSSGDGIIGINQLYIDDLRKKYNTDYFSVSSLYSIYSYRDDKVEVLLLSLMSGVYFLYGVYYCLTPDRTMSYSMRVIDAKNHKIVYRERVESNSKNYNFITKSIIYNSFYYMSQTK